MVLEILILGLIMVLLLLGFGWTFKSLQESRKKEETLQKTLREVRASEAEARFLLQKEKEENRWKDQLMLGTAQEQRSLLQTCWGLVDSVVEGASGASASKELDLLCKTITAFQDSSLRLSQYAGLRTQGFSLDLKPVDLESLVREVVAEQERDPGRTGGIRFQFVPVPPVSADPDRLRYILRNLLETALELNPSLHVRIYPASGERVRLSFLTTPGPERQDLTGWLRVLDGSGTPDLKTLGLPISERLLELHGARLEIHNLGTQGTEVGFELMVQTPVSQEEDLVPLLPLAEEREENRESLKPVVLVVDDDSVNLHLMMKNLATGGYQTVSAASGETALELLAQGLNPDLVVLDVLMPGMDGVEVLRVIRKTWSPDALPVLLLTAKHETSDIVLAFEAGANDFMPKPVGKRELLARISTHLRLSRMSQAYGRFVPSFLLSLLQKNSILDLHLGDFTLREMTILFCDLRSFTSLSEELSPRDNFRFINSFFAAMAPAVEKNGGYIDKFLGDGFMALFPRSPDDGLKASLDLQRSLKSFNLRRLGLGRRTVSMGIGVHTGPVILGTVGIENRMEGTVISDSVNLAARLETQTKAYDCSILVSRNTLFSSQEIEKYNYRFLGNEVLKGKNQSVAIYELFEDDENPINLWKLSSKDRFEQALLLYSRGELEPAAEFFQRLYDENPHDGAVKGFLHRCRLALGELRGT